MLCNKWLKWSRPIRFNVEVVYVAFYFGLVSILYRAYSYLHAALFLRVMGTNQPSGSYLYPPREIPWMGLVTCTPRFWAVKKPLIGRGRRVFLCYLSTNNFIEVVQIKKFHQSITDVFLSFALSSKNTPINTGSLKWKCSKVLFLILSE